MYCSNLCWKKTSVLAQGTREIKWANSTWHLLRDLLYAGLTPVQIVFEGRWFPTWKQRNKQVQLPTRAKPQNSSGHLEEKVRSVVAQVQVKRWKTHPKLHSRQCYMSLIFRHTYIEEKTSTGRKIISSICSPPRSALRDISNWIDWEQPQESLLLLGSYLPVRTAVHWGRVTFCSS